ncbi:hypothetical protein RJ640_013696 [Escallonia rubra]|uniref:F-box/LRR-repeat protein 15-like leucin rich repeat domain-containing protein n=1 Tax=Escallonia rubra TaxID=112253 RepID=A0AA88QQV3_9ASTE|nr:hypothetical protein RJ640_013696 [Escallonia rubra]
MEAPLIISRLTEDILAAILDRVTDESDRKSFRMVCKAFHRVDSLQRTSLRVLRLEFLVSLLRKYPRIEVLDLSVCPRIDDGTVAVLLNGGGGGGWTRRLRRLVLSRSVGLRWTGLGMLVGSCPCLEAVDVSYCCEFGDREAAALSCARGLRDLRMDKCLNVTDVGLAKIAVGCEKLERLSVSSESLRSISSMQKLEVLAMVGCHIVDDDGLGFLGSGCPSLQELSTCVLQRLKDLKNLETIRVDGARVPDSGFQLVSGCPNLRILNLTCCDALTDVAISAIADSCSNILCLKLESCNLLTERSLACLGSRCFLLQDLDLTDCSGVNDRGLNHLSKCSELLCLKLGLCTNISDKGLFYIGLNCTKIGELDIYRCMGIGDDGLAALSRGCRKLKKLKLSDCIDDTDSGIESLSHLEELSDLEMRGLPNITGTGLTALAFGCKRLAELDLKHCVNISDSGFWALAYFSGNLRQINLGNCGISDVGLCMLMGNLTRLQDAKLANLKKVSVNGIELALRVSCIRLKKVKLHTSLGLYLSPEILETLHARGCKIRWD